MGKSVSVGLGMLMSAEACYTDCECANVLIARHRGSTYAKISNNAHVFCLDSCPCLWSKTMLDIVFVALGH
jgi:hypothetical protein